MPPRARLVALVGTLLVSLVVSGAVAKHYLDPLLDEDIRLMLEEKGITTKSLKTRAQLVARWNSLETGSTKPNYAAPSDKPKQHTLLVSFCSG